MSRLITESDLATWAEARAIVISFCRSRPSGTCVIDVMDWIREPLALCQDQGICVLFGMSSARSSEISRHQGRTGSNGTRLRSIQGGADGLSRLARVLNEDVNWLITDEPSSAKELAVRLRGLGPELWALGGGEAPGLG
jgi:hypothetical protein